MGTRVFRRAARLAPPEVPGGEVHLEAPPEIPRAVPASPLMRLLPLVMILGSVGFIVVIGVDNPTSWLFGGMFALSTIGMVAGGASRGGGQRKAEADEDRKDYLRYLAQMRRRARETAGDQRRALEWTHPDPSALVGLARGPRMWERRPADPDFAHVRVGRGSQRLATALVPPQTGPVDDLEPVSTVALRRFVRTHSIVSDLPTAVSLRAFAAVALSGADVDTRRGLVRALLAQLVTMHSPDDLVVAVAASDPAREEWEWVKWLPHAAHPRLTDGAGPVRMITSSLAAVESWLAPELAGRPRFTRGAAPEADTRHVIVVLDEAVVTRSEQILLEEGLTAVTLIDLSDSLGTLTARRGLGLVLESGDTARIGARGQSGTEWFGRPDTLGLAEAEALARRLAPFRAPPAETGDDEPLMSSPGILELLGVDGEPDTFDVSAAWRPRPVRDRLRVPFGVSAAGEPVELDIKEAAQEGMGPHGLCVGATGSGKAKLQLWHTSPVTSTAAPRAGIYCRISRDREGAGVSVGGQRSDCRDLAEALGWPIVAEHSDNDLSAYSGKPRPGYRALLADMEAGRITAVLAWHTDRLHRSPVELEEFIAVSEAHGITTHTVKAGEIDLSTPSGRAVARTLGAWARYESEHRSERVASRREKIAAAGTFLGGTRPFGYRSGGMALEPEEAAAVIEGTAAILRGESLRAVTAEWNRRGLRTTKAEQSWTPSAVRDVLTRARNAGLVRHRGRVVGAATWPRLVTEDQWRGVVGVLSDPKRRTSPGNQPRWLGSNLYRCGVCGGLMTVGTSGQARHPSYRCRVLERGEGHVTRQAKALDDYVSQVIVARLRRPDFADTFTRAEPPAEIDVQALRTEVAGIDANREALARALGDGTVTMVQFTEANDAARGRQEALEEQLARLTRTDPVAVVAGADDPGAAWEESDLWQRREILRMLAVVTVHKAARGRRPGGHYFDPESVRIEWRNPANM